MSTFPKYWKIFLANTGLAGSLIEVPEQDDVSELGASINIYDEEQARDEASNYYPGIAVSIDGFVPVGGCATGSGDPYFININDGKGGPIYRIFHDCVSEDGYSKDEAIEIVLFSSEELANYLSS